MGDGTRTPESSTHSGRGAASSRDVTSVADKVVGQKVEGLKMSEAKDDHPLHAGINAKLAEVAAALPTLPSWYEAWTRLGPGSTGRERLAVYRAVRDAGSVPEDAGFFLVAWVLDVLTDERAEPGLRETDERLEAVRQKYGLGEDVSADWEDVPDEYREALQRSHDAWGALYAATLEEHGEHDMARLFREDAGAFDEKYEAGRQFFHGTGDDEGVGDEGWLNTLREAVGGCVGADSPMGPLGLRYREEEGLWEVWLYPTPVELVGGRHDGAVVVPGFSLDLEQLRECFEAVVALSWDALGLNCPEGPHVAIEGVFLSREVCLQVLASAPAGEEPGLRLDATRRHRPRE
jgi:hypothetical protein